ncbi:hypothetical protein ZYGM_000335 [Zygosaccharomyces mellis]|uniref:type II protein arginine methyltransferase n=1 Tax=Zygosaccharomyces mellis TaxID=42258 RepID=A0A4C2EAR1_9SACH|nr:hypothetical protein ZYGM_000335 [Zygosaccharomyces mellis]
MNRFLLKKPQVRFQSKYPLVQIEELKSHTLRPGQTATIPLRDYYEWNTMPNLLKHEKFFTRRNAFTVQNIEELLFYDPIVTQCIAKWLLVDYKLNAYPYYDLNIVNVFTDLRQAVKIAKSMMTYFQSILSKGMFERIKYFIIPLYNDHTAITEKILNEIPGDVRIVENAAIFPPSGCNLEMEKPFSIEDPVYVLMLNDIIKNLSHDLVRFSNRLNRWQQCYMDIHADGSRSRRFDEKTDFWCQYSIRMVLDQNEYPTEQFHVPTRLVQLFDMLKICAPEHKMFAIDIPQRWQPSLWTMIKLLFGKNLTSTSQELETSTDEQTIHFIANFALLRKIYANVNESAKYCEIEDLSEFVDQWTDLSNVEKHSDLSKDRLNSQMETIHCSNLGVIRTT